MLYHIGYDIVAYPASRLGYSIDEAVYPFDRLHFKKGYHMKKSLQNMLP